MSELKKNLSYFELYDLPVKFHPELAQVKAKFYELSKKHHPDFYASASVEKQEEVLEQSTQNNKAYKTLSSQKFIVKYVLELKHILISGEQYALSQDFLLEMMDVNETLMDLELDEDLDRLTQLKNEIEEISTELQQSLNKLTLKHDENAEDDEALLNEIKDIYYRQKYVARIKERLKG